VDGGSQEELLRTVWGWESKPDPTNGSTVSCYKKSVCVTACLWGRQDLKVLPLFFYLKSFSSYLIFFLEKFIYELANVKYRRTEGVSKNPNRLDF
jgi:hypothetical protein